MLKQISNIFTLYKKPNKFNVTFKNPPENIKPIPVTVLHKAQNFTN